MKIKTTLLLLFSLTTIDLAFAQKHELRIGGTFINSVNNYTKDSDRVENFKHTFSLGWTYDIEYYYRIKESKDRINLTLSTGNYTSRIRFESFPRPDYQGRPSSSGRGIGMTFSDLKLGYNRQSILGTRIDLTLGLVSRIGLSEQRRQRTISCNAYSCRGAFTDFKNFYNDKYKPHLSIFTKIDFRIFKSKRKKHFLIAHIIYSYGLQKNFLSYHYLENLLTGETYNLSLLNRGSYYGVGLSYGLGSTDNSFESIFKNIFKLK